MVCQSGLAQNRSLRSGTAVALRPDEVQLEWHDELMHERAAYHKLNIIEGRLV